MTHDMAAEHKYRDVDGSARATCRYPAGVDVFLGDNMRIYEGALQLQDDDEGLYDDDEGPHDYSLHDDEGLNYEGPHDYSLHDDEGLNYEGPHDYSLRDGCPDEGRQMEDVSGLDYPECLDWWSDATVGIFNRWLEDAALMVSDLTAAPVNLNARLCDVAKRHSLSLASSTSYERGQRVFLADARSEVNLCQRTQCRIYELSDNICQRGPVAVFQNIVTNYADDIRQMLGAAAGIRLVRDEHLDSTLELGIGFSHVGSKGCMTLICGKRLPEMDVTWAEDLLELTNDERRAAGLGPLEPHPQCAAAAQLHAERMSSEDFYEHQDPHTRKNVWDRLCDAGFRDYAWCAENLVKDRETPYQAHVSWVNSAGHRANMVSPRARYVGFGRVGRYWVQVLAA